MMDKNLLAYIKEKRHYLVLITLLSFCGLVSSVSLTLLLCLGIEAFSNNNLIGWYFLLGAFDCALAFAIFFIIKSKLSNKLANYVSDKIRDETYQKYLDNEGHCSYSPQEIAQLSSEGVEQLRLYYTNYLPSFFYAMIAPISLFIMMTFISWKVALIYLICVPLIPVSIIMVSKWAKKIFAVYWDRYISLGGAYLDSVSGMKELLIFHYDQKMQEEMKKSSEEFRKITMKVLVMQLFSTTIMDVVAYGGAAVGITLTILGLQAGDFSPYIALFLCLIGAEYFLPMRSLGSAFHVAMNGATAGKKVLGLLKERSLIEGTEIVDNITLVELKNVNFKYLDSKDYVLKDINLILQKGFYSLIGNSGSGKSTLAKVLTKQLYGYEGSILINGKELTSIESGSFHKHIAYLSNDSFLLSKSIRDGFKFYNPNLTEDEMKNLLNEVNMLERISDAGGLDYIPREGASDLSGGEKQRLVLAYYLSLPKDFIVFDETTSNIDKESEAIIVRKIKDLSRNHVVLFISHRLQNALCADMIYTISKEGTIGEKGTPKELIDNKDNFAKALQQEQLWEVIR